jgi:hypothetical protein
MHSEWRSWLREDYNGAPFPAQAWAGYLSGQRGVGVLAVELCFAWMRFMVYKIVDMGRARQVYGRATFVFHGRGFCSLVKQLPLGDCLVGSCWLGSWAKP